MDELIKLCDKLEREKTQNPENDIIIARKILMDYIGNDYNKILSLKALLKYHNGENGNVINDAGFLISVLSITLVIIHPIFDAVGNLNMEFAIVSFSSLIILLFVFVFCSAHNSKRQARARQIACIEVVLNDIEKQKRWKKAKKQKKDESE